MHSLFSPVQQEQGIVKPHVKDCKSSCAGARKTTSPTGRRSKPSTHHHPKTRNNLSPTGWVQLPPTPPAGGVTPHCTPRQGFGRGWRSPASTSYCCSATHQPISSLPALTLTLLGTSPSSSTTLIPPLPCQVHLISTILPALPMLLCAFLPLCYCQLSSDPMSVHTPLLLQTESCHSTALLRFPPRCSPSWDMYQPFSVQK